MSMDAFEKKLAGMSSLITFLEGGGTPLHPAELFLELSNLCNFQCTMCGTFSALNPMRLVELRADERGFLPLAPLLAKLEDVLPFALNVHCHGYGEPTLHPEFEQLLNLLGRHHIMVDFFTNGSRLADPAFCDLLIDNNVFAVTVSFSCSTQEEYEAAYLGGSFEQVLGGIRLLAERKRARNRLYPAIQINSLSFRPHIEKFDHFVAMMADAGVNGISLKRLQANEVQPHLYDWQALYTPEKHQAILERAELIARERGLALNTLDFTEQCAASDLTARSRNRQEEGIPMSAPAIRETAMRLREARPPRGDRRITESIPPATPIASAIEKMKNSVRTANLPGSRYLCTEPFKTLYIRQNGETKPCCFYGAHPTSLGNVLQHEIVDVWRGAGYNALRLGVLEDSYPKQCEHCLLHNIHPPSHNLFQLFYGYISWHAHCAGLQPEVLIDRASKYFGKDIATPLGTDNSCLIDRYTL